MNIFNILIHYSQKTASKTSPEKKRHKGKCVWEPDAAASAKGKSKGDKLGKQGDMYECNDSGNQTRIVEK